jgi:hypothetical protein
MMIITTPRDIVDPKASPLKEYNNYVSSQIRDSDFTLDHIPFAESRGRPFIGNYKNSTDNGFNPLRVQRHQSQLTVYAKQRLLPYPERRDGGYNTIMNNSVLIGAGSPERNLS